MHEPSPQVCSPLHVGEDPGVTGLYQEVALFLAHQCPQPDEGPHRTAPGWTTCFGYCPAPRGTKAWSRGQMRSALCSRKIIDCSRPEMGVLVVFKLRSELREHGGS